MASSADLLDLTHSLVEIPSHHDPDAGVDAEVAGDAIETWLREHTDADVERDGAPEGGNVIARRSADGTVADADGDPTSLGLVGHHDVVPPADSQVDADDDYLVEERDGRLYGRGTCDMKGPLAAAMIAFATADVPDDRELVFVSFVGEERGGVGAQWALDHGFELDRAVVTEGSTGYSAPGVIDVAVAHKGRRGSTIVGSGESAHASEGGGVNAVYRAVDAVEVVRNLEFPTTDVLGHDVAGSIAVTGIEGGDAWNVIPDRCEVTVDERTVPGERAPLEEVQTLDGIELTIDQDLPPMACENEAFADRVLEVASDVQSDLASEDSPAHVVKPHATDAGWLSDRAGTDCVIVGAAESGEAHTEDESVAIDAVERSVEIYRRVLETA